MCTCKSDLQTFTYVLTKMSWMSILNRQDHPGLFFEQYFFLRNPVMDSTAYENQDAQFKFWKSINVFVYTRPPISLFSWLVREFHVVAVIKFIEMGSRASCHYVKIFLNMSVLQAPIYRFSLSVEPLTLACFPPCLLLPFFLAFCNSRKSLFLALGSTRNTT